MTYFKKTAILRCAIENKPLTLICIQILTQLLTCLDIVDAPDFLKNKRSDLRSMNWHYQSNYIFVSTFYGIYRVYKPPFDYEALSRLTELLHSIYP